MDKQLFDDAIGEVPPSTVDVDAAIARGRRAEWVRRAASPAVTVAAAVVLVTGGVAVALLPADKGGVGVGTAPTSTSLPSESEIPSSLPSTAQSPPPSSAPSSEPPDGPVGPPPAEPCANPATEPEPPAEATSRLTAALTTVIEVHLVQGTRLVPNPGAVDQHGDAHGPLEFFAVYAREQGICGDGYYLSRADTEGPAGTGNLMVLVETAANMAASMTCEAQAVEQTYCSIEAGPNGETVMKSTYVMAGGATTHRVDVVKPDGTGLVISAENVGGTGKTGAAPTADQPPLDHGQLAQAAIVPDVTAFP